MALLQPLGSAFGAVASFLIVVVALRDAQFENLASYGAGVAVAAIVSALIGGGTTLAFTTGELTRQRAVRGVRNRIVLPAIVITSVITAALYSLTTPLQFWALLAGGLATVANVAAELDGSYLRRKLRTVGLFFTDVISRFAGLFLILTGVDYAYAMAACALVRYVFLFVLSRKDPSRRRTERFGWLEARQAYEVKLTSLSIAYIVCDRIGAAIMPIMAPPAVSGGYVAVVGMQQNLSGVLMTGVQTVLAVRSERRTKVGWTNWIEKLIILVAVSIAAVLIIGFEQFVGILGLSAQAMPEQYWVQLVMLLPLALLSRTLDFSAISASKTRIAVQSRLAATGTIFVGLAFGLILQSVPVFTWSLVVGEIAAISTWIVIRRVEQLRKER